MMNNELQQVKLPDDIWDGIDGLAPKDLWAHLEQSGQKTEAQRVDLVGRVVTEQINTGTKNFLEAAMLVLGDPDAKATVSNYYHIFNVFRVGLGYTRDEVQAIGTTRLKPFTQAERAAWALENPEKVHEILGREVATNGKSRLGNESDIRRAVDEQIRGVNQNDQPRDFENFAFTLPTETAKVAKLIMDDIGKALRQDPEYPESTDKRLSLGYVIFAGLTEWMHNNPSQALFDALTQAQGGTNAATTQNAEETSWLKNTKELTPLFGEDLATSR